MNWKSLFSSKILSRGREYCRGNAIKKYEETDDHITAEIAGTELYTVNISLENGEIGQMECTCPYAQDGKACKHMAAVLYRHFGELDEPELFGYLDTVEVYEQRQAAIRSMVDEMDEETVREYLSEILMEEEKYLLRFKAMADAGSRMLDLQRYAQRMDDLAELYMDRYGYIGYYQADEFVAELGEILDMDVRLLMDRGNYWDAFRLADLILSTLDSVEMDDSSGGAGMLAERISRLWIELLTKMDADQKRDMFRWFAKQLPDSSGIYSTEQIEDIFMREFQEEEYLPAKLKIIEEQIYAMESSDVPWKKDYGANTWIGRYFQLLQRCRVSADERKAFCRAHWQSHVAREEYVKLCKENGEYEEALQALDESLTLDENWRHRKNYENQKKEIYQLMGDRKHYEEQLWKLLTNFRLIDLEFYRELRELYEPEVWKEKREIVFRSIGDFQSLNQLLEEEKLYDRLLDAVLQSPGLYTLQIYKGVLGELYPHQILQKYRDELDLKAKQSGNRNHYRQLAEYLEDMKTLEGGPEVVADILADWRVRYKRRPAMMEELSGVSRSSMV